VALALVTALAAARARAESETETQPAATPPPPGAPADQPPRREVRSVGTAIFPGVVVHGAGHWVGGDRQTGWRLLKMEGIGLGALVGGFAGIALTGASRHLAAPVFALPVAGVGLFAISWLSDLYGVSAPDGGTGAPLLTAPALEARLGTRYVHDPTLSYGTLVGGEVDLRWRSFRLTPGVWIATSGDNTRVAAEGAYRLLGPRPASVAATGSFLDVVVGASVHRYGPELFSLTALDGGVRGRVDLRRLADSLAGSFAEWGLGVGVVLTHYRVGARETDADGLLLARFGYGIYLGRAGELLAYYDHRHDGYAGGLKLTGLGSGAAGHLGLDGSWYFLPRWGVRAEFQAGSAYVAGLSLVHRSSGPSQ
jgi:hypothetical protein